MSATEKKELTRATGATTKLVKVRLNELQFDLERFCHRDQDSLSEDKLQALMESRVVEGPQCPPEFFTDGEGRKVVTKGHCRVMADRIQARKKAPGFTEDMEIDAFEVEGANPQDLLIRSIADNEVRTGLTRIERIRVSKKLHDNNVSVDRAARAMGVSTQTYERDLLIAKNSWMFQHVIDDSIQPTHATSLLEEAAKAKRLKEVKEDLDAWVAAKKRVIREREKYLKAQNKDLSDAEKQVKRFMPAHLVSHWVDLIRKKQSFDEDAQWNFAAGIEREKELLRISSIQLDLAKDPLDKLAKVAAKLALIAKQMGPWMQKRKEAERGAGSGISTEEAPYDFEYLTQLGLDDTAKELKRQFEALAIQTVDGEADDARGVIEERLEVDLADSIVLPDASLGADSKALEPASSLTVSTDVSIEPTPTEAGNRPEVPSAESRSSTHLTKGKPPLGFRGKGK